MPAYRHIYVHLPFCDVICHYCDFYTARNKDARYDEFFKALGAEAKLNLAKLTEPLEALYFGGGTPSAAPTDWLSDFIRIFRPWINAETEITLEANPNNITEANMRAWKAMGINRLSMGIQSLDDTILKRLGRVHGAEPARQALRLAQAYIPNISGDLIYGVPGQGEDDPARDALNMAGLGLTHISAYHLTIPSNHFLYKKLPEDSFAWKQIEKVAEALATLGFEHYEVSNFGKPGYHSKNNGNYWRGGPYLALGPSANGFDGESTRWKNVADWEEYVARLGRGESPIEETERLTAEQRRIEILFTSLRTSEGLDLGRFQKEFGEDLSLRHASLFAALEKDGLGTLANGRFVLTFAGRMLTDEIVRKLL
jgi:oxygen-independent coproporphyrinogen-3 oxidase